MSQTARTSGGINQHITRLHLFDGAWLSFVFHRIGAADTKYSAQVVFKSLARLTSFILLYLMIDIAETDFRIATLLPQIFSTQTQGDISALLKITEQRIVHRSTIEYTIASSPPV